MARLSRVTQALFGSTGLVGTGGFGAAALGTTTTNTATSVTLATIMGAANWAAGWLGAVLGSSKFPAVEDMNAVHYTLSSQIAYILQQGIPEYDSGTTYYTNQICAKAGTYEIYGSKTNGNVGNALTSTTNWQFLIDLSTQKFGLAADRTFYVSTTGNDTTGDGSSGSPWATIQHAWDVIQKYYDLNGYTATIQLDDGTYTNNSLSALGPVDGNKGPSSVIINGNSGTPSNVIIDCTTASLNCFNASVGGAYTIANLKVQASGAGAYCVVTNQGGSIQIGNGVIFGAANTAHTQANYGGFINFLSSYTISGNSNNHVFANLNGVIFISPGITVTLTGTPAFAGAFAAANALGSVSAVSVTFSGSATGSRYTAAANGVINTNGGGATYLPGNSAGTTGTGGQYV